MTVVYLESARKQLKRFDNSIRRRILDYMDEIAQLKNPESRGKMLVGKLHGFWRYRVGDYRILCRINDKALVITVIKLGHRSAVYNA